MAKWQALTNISMPRKGDAEKKTDLVGRGDTVELADAEAERINRGHPVPVLRPARAASAPMPVIRPRDLTRRMAGPPADARPDPAGSSRIQVMEPPEANEPSPGDESRLGAEDAVDLPPRDHAGAGAR